MTKAYLPNKTPVPANPTAAAPCLPPAGSLRDPSDLALGTAEERNRMSRTCRLRMTVFAWSFPSLLAADGVYPWDPDCLERWLVFGSPSAKAIHAGRFVLSLWNPDHPWQAGPFKLHDAIACWDDQHRTAFATWVDRPWWP